MCSESDSLRERLARSIGQREVTDLARQACGCGGVAVREALLGLMHDADARVAANAAWVLGRLDHQGRAWLCTKRGELVDEALRTPHHAKRRLVLALLLQQPWDEESLRADLLDFCLARMGSQAETTSVKTLCIKLAYEQCKHHPDLLRELREALLLLEPNALPTGAKTVRRKTLDFIDRALALKKGEKLPTYL